MKALCFAAHSGKNPHHSLDMEWRAAGASRKELLKEALHALGKVGSVDRIGVWIEAEPGQSLQSDAPGQFQGLVWDRENGEMPAEWANISVEPPLPEKSLFAGKCVVQDLEAAPTRPIVGPLVELRRAAWIPIERNGQLKGVILAGSRESKPSVPWTRCNRLRRNWHWPSDSKRNGGLRGSEMWICARPGISSKRAAPGIRQG